MRELRTNTATRITVGPFLDKTDGITPETGLTVTSEKLTLMVDDAGVPTLVLDAAPTASGGNNDMVHVTGDDSGYYDLELTAANLNYLGRACLSLNDVATHLPVFHEFMILSAEEWDSKYATTGALETRGVIDRGTAQSATGTTLVLRSAATFADDTVIGATLAVYGSTQGYWQTRTVTDYVLSTDTATVDTWTVTPSGTITYVLFAGPPASATLQPTVIVGSIAANAITAAATATDFGAEIADAVWDEALSGHTTGGSAGDTLSDAGVAAATVQSALVLASGQLGGTGNDTTHLHLADAPAYADDAINDHLIVMLDVSAGIVYSRWISDWVSSTELAAVGTLPITPVSGDIWMLLSIRQDVTGGSGLDAAGVRAAIGQASASYDTDIASLATAAALAAVDGKIDTIDNLLDTEMPALTTAVADLPTNAELATALAAADDAVLAAIAALNNLSAAQVNAEVVDVLRTDTVAELGAPPAANAALSAKINWLFMLARNKVTQTATTQLLKADDGTTTVGSSTVSDDGTTATRNEWA